jgi:hypothetical protein
VKKKGQVKFGETFGIIFIVYIIVIIGIIWYNNINTSAIQELSDDSQRDRAFEKYHFIMNSNLLHKSQLGDVDEDFDLYSLKSFRNYSKGNGTEAVRSQLGESTILVELYDKELAKLPESPILLYNNTIKPKDGTKKKIETFRSLIPIQDTINKETYIGILVVKTYN